MKPTRLLIFLIAFCLSCAVKAEEAVLISAQDLRNLVVEYPDSVLHVLDRMEQGEGGEGLPSYQVALLRGLAYNEKRMFSLVERYARETLSYDSVNHHDKEKLNALTLLSTAQGYYGDFQGSIASSLKAMDLARKIGNVAAEYNILTTMAKTSFAMGDRKQGYGYLDRIISMGESSDDARTLANVSAAYGVKIVELYADDRFEEGLAEGKKRLGVIDRIGRVGGAPEGFTDQQRAYAYARIASCAERSGRHAEAQEAFGAFMSTDYARHPMGRAYVIDYLLDSGNWNKVLEFTRPLYPILSQGDTINGDYQSLLVSDARAYAGLGRFREAYGLSLRAAAIGDSLQMRENTVRAQELATVFSLNEKELELVNVKASLQRKHILLVSFISAGVLLLIIIFLLIRAYRISVRQQKLAAQRIDELMAADKNKYGMQESQDEDYEVFAGLQQKILKDKLFKQPNFNRESIMQISGLTRGKVVNLIDKYAGLTPNDYINKLRVEYSVKLIQEHPEWTIEAIAEECGYGRRGTYYSNFNKFFGITPAQYRKERLRQAPS